jgi:hypothetical protein
MCICVLCLIVVPLPPGDTPFEVQIINKVITVITVIIIIKMHLSSERQCLPLEELRDITQMQHLLCDGY